MSRWASNDNVRFGLVVPQGWRGDLPDRDFEQMVGVAQEADRLGFDSIWLYDHLQTRDGDPDALFECWTSLAALARETSRVRLGQIVTCNLYRNAGLLAQMAATLDAASGGRALIGLGAGWDEREYADFGFGSEYPGIGDRLRLLGESLRIIKQRTTVPVLVGGAGERVLLRLVAEHGGACSLSDSRDPGFYRHKLAVLRAHCEAVGRDYDAILRTTTFTVSSTELGDGSLRPMFESLVGAGISYFIVYVDPPTDLAALQRFAAELLA
jgi:alkanesulfonate monooxygenase SsuD/methylene tetrahydromethanopterin reductase-like flavin-dependent oxidoreductase (luciferase family)